MRKMVVEEMSKERVFRLCYYDKEFELQGNAYLIIEGQGESKEGILIDPGSIPGYPALKEVLEDKLAGGWLSYVILQHQDPDICACLPHLEESFPGFTIVTHWRAAVLIKHYGLISQYSYIDNHRHTLNLTGDKQLYFFHTPYAHSPASIMTYDPSSKVLFTGDLFGAFSSYNDSQGVIDEEKVNEEYFQTMKLFHENFIPSKDIINLAMQQVENINRGPGIKWIASQHGTPLPEDKVQEAINSLKNLECGDYLVPLIQEMSDPPTVYRRIMAELIDLQASIFGRKYWVEMLKDKGFLDGDGNLLEGVCHAGGLEDLMKLVFNQGGYIILDSMKNRVLKYCNMYSLPLPDIFSDTTFRDGEKQLTDFQNVIQYMSGQVDTWQSTALELQSKVDEINNTVNRDPLTGLYNRNYLYSFLDTALEKIENNSLSSFSLMVIGIDDVHLINEKYGEKKGDGVVAEMAVFLKEQLDDNNVIFRYQGPVFFVFLPEASIDYSYEVGEILRNSVLKEHFGRIKVKVSIGLTTISKGAATYIQTNEIIEDTLQKLRQARKNGGNLLVQQLKEERTTQKKALVADFNPVSRRLMIRLLEELGLKCLEADDGVQAEELLKTEELSLVVVEAMLPKHDGYYLLNYTRHYSSKIDAPVVFISAQNDPEDVAQALDKGAADYIYKPFYLPLVKARLKKIIRGVGS